MDAVDILRTLVGFKAVVGQPNDPIVTWTADYLARLGGRITRITGPEGDRDNLFASFGPDIAGGVILSGHMDVVEAQESTWQSDPFSLRADEDKLYGRGTSDMQGFLAAVLATLPAFTGRQLARPIHIAFSYDEEAGCLGVPHLIAALPQLCLAPDFVLVGEPTSLIPVLGHKGKASYSITIHGKSGHSARPDLGLNAIEGAWAVLGAAMEQAESIKAMGTNPLYTPPYSTLQVGTLQGGVAVNIIPETCVMQIEARALPNLDPIAMLAPVIEAARMLESRGFRVATELLSSYPGHTLSSSSHATQLLARITGNTPQPAVSWGTEAGCFAAAGYPAIICGPGDMSRAHRANEFLSVSELRAAEAMIAEICAFCLAN